MHLIERLARFISVGALATGLQYALLMLLVELAAMHAVTASAVGFTVSAVFNYVANYHITFSSNRRHSEAAPRFTAVSTIGLALNSTLLYLLTEEFGLHYLLAQIVGTVLVTLWNFEANRRWTYQSR